MDDINPQVLAWARQSAGLSLEVAASKIGLREARGLPPADRLASVESGETTVTRPLLVKMAKAYHRPLVTFYMATPPIRDERGEDYRSVPERHTAFEPLVDAIVRDARARQSIVRSMLADEEAPHLSFVGSLTTNVGIGVALSSLRRALKLDLADYRSQGSAESAFGLLRDRTESLGVFVLLISNLGSHHTSVDASAFRGFALADSLAPFVVINDQDSKAAWSFTLLHELTHLWLGATGISGTFVDSQIERFCNDVASHFLLSSNELPAVGIDNSTTISTATQLITAFANERLISRSMVAYRLFRDEHITEGTWQNLKAFFRSEWLARRAAQRAHAREREGGPNYYVVRRHRIGSALLQFAARGLSEGSLSPTKAAKVLGVKPRSIATLLSGSSARSEIV
jgi:Zn-dependent peptidase ImmA (M78 family)/transcriptional regulator with XRE-family HTH domain